MLKQNGTIFAQYPVRRFGGAFCQERQLFGGSDRRNWMVGEHAPDRKSGRPDGTLHPGSWLLPGVAGGMASRNNIAGAGATTFAVTGGVNGQATLSGTGAISSATAQLVISMVATIAGTGSVSAADLRGYLNAVATISGAGSVTASVAALAWANAALSGTGTISNATPYATGELAATIRGYSDLTPEGIADKVWAALAVANNSAGSMGELLNSAGAAADPLLGVVEGTLTLRDVQRIVLAVLAGQVTGAGTGTETFKGQAGEHRVVSTVDANGNRSSVTLDAA